MNTIKVNIMAKYSFVTIFLFLASTLFSMNNVLASNSKEINLSNLTALHNVKGLESGQSFKGESFKKGEKALIYFWASWCPDCKSKLKKDLKEMHGNGIHIFTINKDSRAKKAERFIEKHSVKLPVYLDKKKEIAPALKAFSVPHWAVIENKGISEGKSIWTVLKYASGNIDPAKKLLKSAN